MADLVTFDGKKLVIFMSTGTELVFEQKYKNVFTYYANGKKFYDITVRGSWKGLIKDPHIPAAYKKQVKRKILEWETKTNE